MLTSDFVPYAGDQWYLHRQNDSNGEFFWKVVGQGYRKEAPKEETRQGVYAAAPDGEILGSLNTWSPEKTLAMLRGAKEKMKERSPSPKPASTEVTVDAAFSRVPPK